MLDTPEPMAGFFRNLIFPVLMYFGRKIMYDENRKIVRTSATRLIKGPCTEQELEAMLFVTDQPSIQAPRVHRTYRRHDGLFIEMDFILGRRLDQAWPDLEPNEREAVVKDLGKMIIAIRGVPIEKLGNDVNESHHTDYKSVFTHADLCPRNIILKGNSLQPVLIDWEFAGWWPEYWEHTKSVFAMWEDLPGWAEQLAAVLPQYPVALAAERVLWKMPSEVES